MNGFTLVASGVLLSTYLASALGRPAVADDDACARTGIRASAQVSVSDGSRFRVSTNYRSPTESAIRFDRDSTTTMAVEGDLTWSGDEQEAALAPERVRGFVLGHQFHAFVRDFEGMVESTEPARDIEFGGRELSGIRGRFRPGGTVYLLREPDDDRPVGLRIDLPGAEPVEAAFADWREHQGREYPFRIRIDDGEREFEYRYTELETAPTSPLWFYAEVLRPLVDVVRVQRLHRRLLIAHCLGDAGMMADLTAKEAVVANKGEVTAMTPTDMRKRFESVFKALDYSAYLDLQAPRVNVAGSGDIAWLVANVRAVGAERAGGAPFSSQWAWVMLAKKQNGRWLNAGIAANQRPE